MQFYHSLPRPFFVLAPMDDVTDTVFRQMVAQTASPDLFFTEFVNVDGLQSPGRQRLLPKLRFTPPEVPLVAHLWGKQPDNFYRTAKQIADGSLAQEMGLPAGSVFVGIDLNMGCPVKNVVASGTCSALMNDRPLASAIIAATQKGAESLPVSVKTRLGFNEVDMSWPEFLLGHNLAMLTVHGRTRKQMSKVPADWDSIGKIGRLRDTVAPTTLIVGNGDVLSRSQGLDLAQKYHLDGIMIGRGVFQDPFVFKEDSPWQHYTPRQRIALYKRQVELFAATWQSGERAIHTLNKFCKVYISGFDGAKELREELMQATTTDELLGYLEVKI